MSATGEELASQSEQLQATIGFFRIDTALQAGDGGHWTGEKAAPVRPVPRPPGMSGNVKREKEPEEAAGFSMDLGDGPGGEEMQDSDFEKY
jgi:hypothetical protein